LVIYPSLMVHNKRQLQQLFQKSISNSLKYAKINEDPKITIECSGSKGH
jgi:light-regulated signal transduction histidine kinase (bacteriophytochrome)